MNRNLAWLFFVFAVVFSAFWAVYGVKQEKEDIQVGNEKIKEEKNKRTMYSIKRLGVILSEFVGSFAGWCCFYILIYRIQYCTFIGLNGVDVFLIIGAVIGMAGYSYKIVEAVKSLG